MLQIRRANDDDYIKVQELLIKSIQDGRIIRHLNILFKVYEGNVSW